MSATLLESVEGLGHSPFATTRPGETWERLQAEKEDVMQHLLAEAGLCANDAGDLLESAAADEYAREIKWRQRELLEGRLRELNEAQDRLIEGTHGRCTNCADEIDSKRLLADPAVARCVVCQRSCEIESALPQPLEIGSIH